MTKKEDNENKKRTAKYGNDYLYESPIDTYICHPLGLFLVDYVHKLNITPNQITILSTISTIFSCYWIYNNKLKTAVFYYLLGYIFDCIDGRLARKYNLGSKKGAAMDMVSDVITNTILFATLVIFKRSQLTTMKLTLLIVFFVGITVCHGFTEAIASYKKTGDDNFFKKIKEDYGNINAPLYKMYVYFNKNSYDTYKCIIKKYDSEKIHKYMKILKYFGPGTFNLIMSIIILGLK